MQSFGEFVVSSSFCRLDHWHSKPAKLLFAYLLVKKEYLVTKEEIMEILWPDCSPASSAGNLKTVVYQLRETLRPLFGSIETNPILFKENRYIINPAIDLELDFVEFDRRWKHGKQLEKEGKPGVAKAEYEAVEKLYKGDFLAEEPYQEWTIPYRESIKDNYFLLLEKLCSISFESADYDDCIGYCQKILTKDVCREDAYRKLMQCYNCKGQNAYALHWYEKCRENIKLSLNIPLSKETEELYASIKSRGTFSQHDGAMAPAGADMLNPRVMGLTVSDVTPRSANFKWTLLKEAYDYYIFVNKTQQTTYNTAQTSAGLNVIYTPGTSFARVNGLTPGTQFYVSVWANDPANTFMGSTSFATPAETSGGWSELASPPPLDLNEHITWLHRLKGQKLHDTISTFIYITTARDNLTDRIWLFDGSQWSVVYSGSVDRMSNIGNTLFGYKTGTHDDLIISTDGGLTWAIRYPAPPKATGIRKWSIRMRDPNTILWADVNIFYKSTDKGKTWMETKLPIGTITFKRAPNGDLTACGVDGNGVVRAAQFDSSSDTWEIIDLPVPFTSKALVGTPNQSLGYDRDTINGLVVTATTVKGDAGWWLWDFNNASAGWRRIDNGNKVNQGIALTNNTGAVGNSDEGNGVAYCMDENSILRLRGNAKQIDRVTIPASFGDARFIDMMSTFTDPGAAASTPNNVILLVCTDGDNQAEKALIYRDALNCAVSGLTISNLLPSQTSISWSPMDTASKYLFAVSTKKQSNFYSAKSDPGLIVLHRANETMASVTNLLPNTTYYVSVWAFDQAASFMGSLTFTTPSAFAVSI